jgi:hypothetical protein
MEALQHLDGATAMRCLESSGKAARMFDVRTVSRDDGCQAIGWIAHACGRVQMAFDTVQICAQAHGWLVAARPAEQTVGVFPWARKRRERPPMPSTASLLETEEAPGMKINRYAYVALLAVAATALSSVLVFSASSRARAADAALKSTPPVDAKGNLHVPSNYRQTYEYLGSWAIAADKGSGSKQIHEVYASPGTIEAYRKTGKFPNGITLIKEVFATQTSPMTTGTVSRVGKLQGWFVMVRDDKNDHPGNPLWAKGWGWSWFDAGKPEKTTSKSFEADCQGCHIPARKTDWVYTQGYAPLRR